MIISLLCYDTMQEEIERRIYNRKANYRNGTISETTASQYIGRINRIFKYVFLDDDDIYNLLDYNQVFNYLDKLDSIKTVCGIICAIVITLKEFKLDRTAEYEVYYRTMMKYNAVRDGR